MKTMYLGFMRAKVGRHQLSTHAEQGGRQTENGDSGVDTATIKVEYSRSGAGYAFSHLKKDGNKVRLSGLVKRR